MHLSLRTLHKVATVTAYQLVFCHTVVEIFYQIVQRTGFHRGVAIELQAPTLLVEHTEPAHIGVVA